MSPREAARRRLVAAMWCGYAALFLVALAAVALDDDEDQAAELDPCPFDRMDEPKEPADVDRMLAREAAAYRAGWDERGRYEGHCEPARPRG